MLTSVRLREEAAPAGLVWISWLRSNVIRQRASDERSLQLPLFDEHGLERIRAGSLGASCHPRHRSSDRPLPPRRSPSHLIDLKHTRISSMKTSGCS
jgi:hypothetical protein